MTDKANDMNELNDFEQRLRRQLADHVTPPPAAGWERIERTLARRAAAGRRRRLALWGTALSAAAAALVAVFLPASSPIGREALAPVAAVSSPAASRSVENAPTAAEAKGASYTIIEEMPLAAALPAFSESSKETAEENAPAVASVSPAVPDSIPECFEESPTVTIAANTETSKEVATPRRAATKREYADLGDLAMAAPKRTVSVKFGIEGSAGSSSSSAGYVCQPIVSSSANQAQSDAAMSNFGNVLSGGVDGGVESHVNYKVPMGFAVKVNIPLGRRFSVDVGATYTRTGADVRSGTSDSYYATEQRLHFVGIMAGAGFDFLHTRRFVLYTTATAGIEKCVGGTSRTDYIVMGSSIGDTEATDIGRSLWQGRVGLAVGAQVDIAKGVGFYAEPSLSYYIPDGSSLPSARRETPFWPGLQAGLRITVR